EIVLRATTPFARVAARAFTSQSAGVLVVEYEDETEEDLTRRIDLERWGTRSLLHWYQRLRRTIPLSLTESSAGIDDSHIWIEQRLRDLTFAVAARLDGPAQPRLLNRRAAAFESAPARRFAATLFLAVLNSEEADDPL